MLLLLLLSPFWFCLAADITLYCKCSCPPHVSRVLTVPKCTSCTKVFCIENEVCPNITAPAVPGVSPAIPLSISDDKLPVAASPSPSPSLSSQPELVKDGVVPHANGSSASPQRDYSHVAAELVPRQPDDNWVAECFQRGSYKDEVVVYIFIILVCGLLVYAILKPHIETLVQRYQDGYHTLA